MIARITMNAEDIAAVIAEKFGVRPEDVSVAAKKTLVGYGPGEDEIWVPEACLTIPLDRLERT